MASDLAAYRRFFADDMQLCSDLRTPGLVDALATVERERFLPPGPWVIRSESDFQAPLRHTPDADPRFVYHNVSIGLDPARMLFNGAPGFVSKVIDALVLEPGQRVLHIGTGAGYYTALMAHVVGPGGRVVGIEVDPDLARQAAANLAGTSSVHIRPGDGRAVGPGTFDAIFVNAGVTHPEPAWLDALAPGGRMALPLTAAMGATPHPAGAAMKNIGKGLLVIVTRTSDPARWDARVLTFVAIYSAVGLRDDEVNTQLGRAMAGTPFPAIRQFRRDPHDPAATCWCHSAHGCWSTETHPV